MENDKAEVVDLAVIRTLKACEASVASADPGRAELVQRLRKQVKLADVAVMLLRILDDHQKESRAGWRLCAESRNAGSSRTGCRAPNAEEEATRLVFA